LFAEIDRRSNWLAKEGKPQDVSNTAWACATLGFEAPNLFAEIDRRSNWLVKEGNPQNVANTAWACATLGFEAPNLVAEIDRHSNWLVKEGSPQNVANIAWAYATLGFDVVNFLSETEARADDVLPCFTEQDVGNTCFAIVVGGCSQRFSVLLASLWDRAIQMSTLDRFNDSELSQLAQSMLFARADGTELPEVPQNLLGKMNLAMKRDNKATKSQEEIFQLLGALGVPCELEVSPVPNTDMGGMLAIDVACKEEKIAIEFDGPWHFLNELGSGKVSQTENGTTRAKRQFLENLGWTVINIDYRDWIKAKSSGNEKHWLRKKLSSCMLDDGGIGVMR
jgi:hypothetical protein